MSAHRIGVMQDELPPKFILGNWRGHEKKGRYSKQYRPFSEISFSYLASIDISQPRGTSPPPPPLSSSTMKSFQVPFGFVPSKPESFDFLLGLGAGEGKVSPPPTLTGLKRQQNRVSGVERPGTSSSMAKLMGPTG